VTLLEEFVSVYVEWEEGQTWPEAMALAEERDAMAAYQLEQSVIDNM